MIYKSHPGVEVVAVCDMEYRKAAAVAEKIGIPEIYGDYNEMFSRSMCDTVAIVTPDFAHAEIAIAAAQAKKNMIIEKPLATTREDVLRIVDAIDKNNVRAMVDLHNRWSPPFNSTYQAIQERKLGNVHSAYFRLNDIRWVATDMLPWASKSSILWFLGSHSLDTLRWLFGDEVRRVYSVSRSGILRQQGVDVEDIYLTTLEFAKGGIAQMENGWITPNANPCINDIKCNILGTSGMIAIDTSNSSLIQMYTDHKVIIPDVMVQNLVFGQPKSIVFILMLC